MNTIGASGEWWDWKIKSQSEDYQDAYPDEHEGSDESNDLIGVPNYQPGMSYDEIGKASGNGRRKSSGGMTQVTKKKTGREIISASISNLVSWSLEVKDRRAASSTEIPSISECICIIHSLLEIVRGSQLYFYAMEYMRN
ncbi:Uncharacterized protein Fot_21769 [Forsythia ovata]